MILSELHGFVSIFNSFIYSFCYIKWKGTHLIRTVSHIIFIVCLSCFLFGENKEWPNIP